MSVSEPGVAGLPMWFRSKKNGGCFDGVLMVKLGMAKNGFVGRGARNIVCSKGSRKVVDRVFPEKALLNHIDFLFNCVKASGCGFKNKIGKDLSISTVDIQLFAKSLVRLQRGLTGDRCLAGDNYMSQKAMLNAYLLYYWPISYIQVGNAVLSAEKKILNLILVSIKENRPFKVLDIGSGPGPASVSFFDFCLLLCKKNNLLPRFEFSIKDSSNDALLMAKDHLLFSAKSFGFNEPLVNFSVSDFEKDDLLDDSFDVVLSSHCLNELWKNCDDKILRRCRFIENIGKNMVLNGLIFLIEPALLLTSRNLISVRDYLVLNGFNVVSPCQNSTACPAINAGEQQTCHSEVFWNVCEPVSSLAKAAGLDRESVKMTYFVFEFSDLKDVKKNNVNSLNENFVCATVVSDGMINKSGRVRFLLCNGNSRFPFSAKKDDLFAEKQGFFDLKRYDKIRISDFERRGDGDSIGFSENTVLKKIED